jgi:hypothetical protein
MLTRMPIVIALIVASLGALSATALATISPNPYTTTMGRGGYIR